MNSYYGPQNTNYGYANTNYGHHNYAQAPQPQYAPMPVAPQNSGSGMKMVAGAMGLLAIGIAAFAIVLGMNKTSTPETTAQSAPSTVFNIPSEINIPSLDSSSPSAPVVVNNPSPRVITIPGQAPAQQAPVQQAPVQNPAANGNDDGQAKIEAQKQADAQAKAETEAKAAREKADAAAKAAQQKADADAAAKAVNDQKIAELKAAAQTNRANAANARAQAAGAGVNAPVFLQQAAAFEQAAGEAEAAAAALGG